MRLDDERELMEGHGHTHTPLDALIEVSVS
jgi:hypothetical protein